MVVFSKFQTIPTTCVEFIHPWTNSCSSALTGLAIHEIQESSRIYLTVYLLALLMRGKIPNRQDLKRTLLGILQSSAFLSCSGFSFTMFACLLRRIFHGYNILTIGFCPSLLSSYVSIYVERPSRRSLLCLYVTNVASETLFNMARSRGLVKRIRHAEVAIFAISMTILLYKYRGIHDKRDSIYSLIRFMIGPYEEYNLEIPNSSENNISDEEITSTKKGRIVNKIMFETVNTLSKINEKFKNLSRHESCIHPNSCVHYTLRSFIKMFSIGYGLQIGFRILIQMKRFVKNPKHIFKQFIHKDAFNLGLFLGGFSGVYRMVSCILRRFFNKDSRNYSIPAGLLAGLMFIFFPDNSLALYIMWKSLQIMYKDQVDKGNLPNIPGGGIFLYCFSTAILFHAAIVEPKNLRPSYWKFLHKISGGRMAAMQRQYIEIFGYESEKQLQETLLVTKTKLIPIKY